MGKGGGTIWTALTCSGASFDTRRMIIRSCVAPMAAYCSDLKGCFHDIRC